jgi:hypothetical protein
MKAAICWIGLSLTFATAGQAQTADRCSDVLKNGVFNENRQLNQSNYKSELKDALCGSSDSAKSNGSGHDGTGSFAGFKLGYSDNSSEAQSLKANYCHAGSAALSTDDLNWVMQSIASQTVINAWSKCMERYSSSKGLSGEIENVNGDNFNFKVHWNASLGVGSVTVSTFTAKGATCDPSVLSPGVVIGTEDMVQPCVRNGTSPVSVILNTNHGAAVGTLDATPLPQKSMSELTIKCMNRSATDCLTLSNRVAETCTASTFECTTKTSCWKNKGLAITRYDGKCLANETQEQCSAAKRGSQGTASVDCDHFFLYLDKNGVHY